MKMIFVGMSGGVDSSVTVALLKERGFNVVGVHLKCWNVDGCAEQDAEDARRAAEVLGIPFYVFNFEKEYRERVVSYMVDAYKKGITPNPDVACNQEIKFGLFYDRALKMGADYVATGHYVRRKGNKLFVAKDNTKDQSYFLWTLTPEQIKHCLFPLGNLIKRTEVRKLAKKLKLPNAEKKDSQGICFLGDISLPKFLSGFIPQKRGAVLSLAGEKLGEHQGAFYYTIGQRRGIGIGGSALPQYVAEKDVKKNVLVLAPENDPALFKKEVELTSVNFLSLQSQHSDIRKNVGMLVWARVRYRQPLFVATLKLINSKTAQLKFDRPVKFVAPGQSAVFYSKAGEMLGGGIITQAK